MNIPDSIETEVNKILGSVLGPTVRDTLDLSASFNRLQSVRALIAAAPELPAAPALLCRPASGEPVSVTVIAQKLTVGRGSAAALSLPAAGRLSKEHFLITRNERGHLLQHRSKTNRTLLNDAPCEIDRDYILLDGDVIVAGGVTFVFLEGTSLAE